MSLCAKFQKDSFIRSRVFRKNVKRTFLPPESVSDDFSKIFFHGDIVSNGTNLCVEFNDCRPNSLSRVESQRNHRSRRIRASLNDRTPLVVISGTLTAPPYVVNILPPVTLSFLLRHPGLIFQHNNICSHTTHVAINCLRACLLYFLDQLSRLISFP